jgi:hypothetical protein
MSQILFKDYLYEKFVEWEKKQTKRRSSFSAFARWLSDNSLNIEVKQQNVDTWMNGKIPKDYKYVVVLAEKLGNEVYEILGKDRPNILHLYASRNWEKLSPKIQLELAKTIAKHTKEPIPDEATETQSPKSK